MTHVGAYTMKGFSAPLITRTSGSADESGTGMGVASAEARGVAWTSLCRNRLATEAPLATVEAAAERKRGEGSDAHCLFRVLALNPQVQTTSSTAASTAVAFVT